MFIGVATALGKCGGTHFTRTAQTRVFSADASYICHFFIFCKKGGSVFFLSGIVPLFCCTFETPNSCHSTTVVQDVASVLGLKSYVGPLGDMTIAKPRVQQSFDHHLLNPARLEIKRGLSAGFFKGGHVGLASQLLWRIKDLQRKRDERDRKRRLSEKEKQVCMSCTTVSHDSPAKAVSTCSSLVRQPCTAALHSSVVVDRNAQHSFAWQCGSRHVVHSFRCTVP